MKLPGVRGMDTGMRPLEWPLTPLVPVHRGNGEVVVLPQSGLEPVTCNQCCL